MCAGAPWLFESKKLTDPAGTTCAFTETSTTLDGYKLIGSCSDGRTDRQDIVTLTFNENAGTMRAEAKSLGPIDLIYCGG